MPTIQQVAAQAGVSAATVSRLINKNGYVASETAVRVRSAMDSLGYAAPAVRRGRKPDRHMGVRTGAVVFLSIHPAAPPEKMYRMPAFPLLLSGIQHALAARGLDLILAHSPEGRTVPPVLARNQADGVIMFGFSELHGELRKVLRDIPLVWCFRSPSAISRQVDHVFYDNSHIGEIAADYFFEQGLGEVISIGLESTTPVKVQRPQQFIQCARAHGMNAEGLVLKEKEDITELVDRILEAAPRPEGIFCITDDLMLGVFNELYKRGVKPEEDIKLIGCNNDPAVMRHMRPRPATIDIKLETVGQRSVEQLIRRMAHPETEDRAEIFVRPLLVPPEKTAGQDEEEEFELSKMAEVGVEV